MATFIYDVDKQTLEPFIESSWTIQDFEKIKARLDTTMPPDTVYRFTRDRKIIVETNTTPLKTTFDDAVK